MSENKIKLSPPWIEFYREMDALFGDDPEVRVEYDDESVVIKLYVDNQEKAQALTKLLPVKKDFGSITIGIQVIPANGLTFGLTDLFRQAFAGNPALSYIGAAEGPFANQLDYVVFRNKVVQFFNDNIGDINGLKSTLYEDIAKNVFEYIPGIFFCTDMEGNPGESARERP